MALNKDIEKDMTNPLKLESFKETMINLFTDNVSDRHLGILKSDVPTKPDINTYRLISKILKLTSYKFNKKTQKLMKIYNKK